VDHRNTTSPVRPPWIEYPHSEPAWGGWRQGPSEAWLRDVWLPFWKRLSRDDRGAYLEQWPPPTDEWMLYVNHIWI
jgi:hypothetical protein